jgi:hypothetical protein
MVRVAQPAVPSVLSDRAAWWRLATSTLLAAVRVIGLTLVAGTPATLLAQDLEPRSYSNSPIGLNFLVASYGYAEGSVLTDPSLPIDNAGIETHSGVVAFATTFALLGQSAKFDVVLPSASLSAHADVAGVLRERSVTGLGDPNFRFSMNFIGAPALSAAEFKDYRQDLIFGASLRIGVPLGQYDEDKLVNIGGNRWSFRPEIGLSKAIGPWTLDLAPGAVFFTDNGDFFGGRTREQSAMLSVQSGVSYTFAPGCWLALGGSWYWGGETTVDNVEKDDQQEGLRFGVTFALPINRHQSIKLYALTGINEEGDRNLDAIGLAWQYRWGGGF